MKFFSLVIIVFAFACSNNPSQNNQDITPNDSIHDLPVSEQRLSAVDFNNEMTLMQEGILDQVDVLFQSDSANVDVNLENTLFEIALNLESLATIKFPEHGEEFVIAMQKLLLFYQQEFTGPFNDIASLLKKSNWTKADEKRVEDYDVNFVKMEKAWFDTVMIEQDKFAKESNIRLE